VLLIVSGLLANEAAAAPFVFVSILTGGSTAKPEETQEGAVSEMKKKRAGFLDPALLRFAVKTIRG
jgi:hypothetical protein